MVRVLTLIMILLVAGATVSYLLADIVISDVCAIAERAGISVYGISSRDLVIARAKIAVGGALLWAWPAVMLAIWRCFTRGVQTPRSYLISFAALLSAVVWGVAVLGYVSFGMGISYLTNLEIPISPTAKFQPLISVRIRWAVWPAILAAFPVMIGFLWRLGLLRTAWTVIGITLLSLGVPVILSAPWTTGVVVLLTNYLITVGPNLMCCAVLVSLGIGIASLVRWSASMRKRARSTIPEREGSAIDSP
ncbi:MAG: hypothetical protein U9Q78_05380 [Chloroflexota bacterium]|nr:hypothetical protein [Chloroflexota bacterium]